MNSPSKNRLLIGLVVLLLIANAVSLAVFWISRIKKERPQGHAKEFLVTELDLDAAQQKQFDILRKEHRRGVDSLRGELKRAKDELFDLVKNPAVNDSMKSASAEAVSRITQKIDLFTVEHFQKVRALCRPDQQKRFDEILHQVTTMMGPPPPPPPGDNGPRRPPPPVQ